MNFKIMRHRKGRLMDPGIFFENVFITILIALTFITIVLTFLYMTFTREETETS